MKTKGRMPLLEDQARRSAICTVISLGSSRATAAKYVGIHPDTIRRAMERDESFAAEIAKAESSHEVNQLMNINKAARSEKFWRAAAWKLERKYPDEYRPRQPDTMTPPETETLLRELARLMLEFVPGLESQKLLIDRLNALKRRTCGPSRRKRRRRGRRRHAGPRCAEVVAPPVEAARLERNEAREGSNAPSE